MITLRSCLQRYASHIEALSDKAPEMLRVSRADTGVSPFLAPEETEQDRLNLEQELEHLGPLAYQQDKRKKLQTLVADIEKIVKEECQKIYQGPSQKWLNGPDKLPDWIRPYLDNFRKNMHTFRINSCL